MSSGPFLDLPGLALFKQKIQQLISSKAEDSVVVKTITQSLNDTQKNNVCENIGLNQAIRELIQEYGGTVPNSLSDLNESVNSDDPWTDLR